MAQTSAEEKTENKIPDASTVKQLKDLVMQSVKDASVIVECTYASKLVQLPYQSVHLHQGIDSVSLPVAVTNAFADSCASTSCIPSTYIPIDIPMFDYDDFTILKGNFGHGATLAPIVSNFRLQLYGLKKEFPAPFAVVSTDGMSLRCLFVFLNSKFFKTLFSNI